MHTTRPWRHEARRQIRSQHTGLGPKASFVIDLVFTVVTIALLGRATAFGKEVAVGDSLAVGFGQASGMPTRAIVGISSCRIVDMVPAGHYDFMLISAGTNDPPGRCVEAVRARADAYVVEWVVPVNGARGHVLAVAAAHGDQTLFYTPAPGNVHPRGYFDVHRGVRLHRELLTPDGRLPPRDHHRHLHRRRH